MTTPTETGLLRYAKIDGKTFIVDAEGRVLAQCVPVKPSIEMQLAFACGFPLACAMFNDDEEQENTEAGLRDALKAATVDVSAAVVKVPERKSFARGNDFAEGEMCGWNNCIDELESK